MNALKGQIARAASWPAYTLLCLLSVYLVATTTIKSGTDLRWNEYGYSDLLINYSQGFIRRGLLGSLIHRNLGDALSSLHFVNRLLFFNFLCFVVLFALLTLLSRKRTAVAALLIPGGIVTIAFGNEVFFRKEMFFYTALALSATLVSLAYRVHAAWLRRAVAGAAVVCILLSGLLLPFLHESFLFLTAPPSAFLLAAAARLFARDHEEPGQANRLVRQLLGAYGATQVALFLLMSYFKGGPGTSGRMASSISAGDLALLHTSTTGNAFDSLSWGLGHAIWMAVQVVLMGAISYWLVPLFAGFLYCVALAGLGRRRNAGDSTVQPWIACYLVLLGAACPLFLLGWDWGRWMVGLHLSFAVLWLVLQPVEPWAGTSGVRLLMPVERWIDRASTGLARILAPFSDFVVRRRALVLTVMAIFTLTFRLPECCLGSRSAYDRGLIAARAVHPSQIIRSIEHRSRPRL